MEIRYNHVSSLALVFFDFMTVVGWSWIYLLLYFLTYRPRIVLKKYRDRKEIEIENLVEHPFWGVLCSKIVFYKISVSRNVVFLHEERKLLNLFPLKALKTYVLSKYWCTRRVLKKFWKSIPFQTILMKFRPEIALRGHLLHSACL